MPRFVLERATLEDLPELASLFPACFCTGTSPQVPFFAALYPPNDKSTVESFEQSFVEQMQLKEGECHFIAVRDTHSLSLTNSRGKAVGFANWIPPEQPHGFSVPCEEANDAPQDDELYIDTSPSRQTLMGNRPHWFLEIIGVDAHYQRCGIGSMMMEYGRQLVDADGLEACVDATMAARRLYQKFGFEERAQYFFDEPWSWYTEYFMVRPATTYSS